MAAAAAAAAAAAGGGIWTSQARRELVGHGLQARICARRALCQLALQAHQAFAHRGQLLFVQGVHLVVELGADLREVLIYGTALHRQPGVDVSDPALQLVKLCLTMLVIAGLRVLHRLALRSALLLGRDAQLACVAAIRNQKR